MLLRNKIFPIAALLLFLFSCAGDSPKQQAISEDNIDEFLDSEIELDSILIEKDVVNKLDLVIENLVLSDKIVELLSKDSSAYNTELLHDPSAAGKYAASKEKAIILGVYGADMNYVLHYEQTQQSFKFLLVSKQLAENIGVAMAFDQNTMKNYQDNSAHKDSLINIVHTAYANVKKHLKNGDQFLMSTMVIAGTWLENMHLATSHYISTDDPTLKADLGKRILDQKEYLNSVIVLLNDLTSEDEAYVNGVIESFNGILPLFGAADDQEKAVIAIKDSVTQIRSSLLLLN